MQDICGQGNNEFVDFLIEHVCIRSILIRYSMNVYITEVQIGRAGGISMIEPPI